MTMKKHKNGNTDANSYGESVMNYVFSDFEWQMILNKYERHQSELNPLVRNNISNLIHSMAVSKKITTVQQANLFITLLRYKEGVQEQEYEEVEQVISHKDNGKIKVFDDDTKIMRINEIVEQLRLLIIQYQVHENCKKMCHDLLRDRR